MEAPPLDYFIYISRAVEPFTETELRALLVSAHRHNAPREVTGLLIYDYVPDLDRGQFCQYVEGPPEVIADVRRRIKADPRHTFVDFIQEGKSQRRLFASWTMGFVSASELPDAEAFRKLANLRIPSTEGPNRPAALLRVFLRMSQQIADP